MTTWFETSSHARTAPRSNSSGSREMAGTLPCVAHELQDIRRLAGSTCGVRHQCPQGPMHRIVRVLDASSHAVQRSGEHFLAIGAEVGHDGGALGRPQLPGSGLEPEQLSKARRDP
eukprot:CAMPEP_0177568864 /NCGR_PEP_ID=MMETSP0369-20130122/75997_1 /TAXON_ID=447022 ORGANISM="Scrippsiella hangoei-like, Strain SHHI-4" /NCGR_SAMPLE_ID=MMETSP0369 /ASSEMBLY_ACC=CAM_ASM_000364 /LENGTH=115 /DNA_ID=CAMNT_0019056489 /DNA_START=301 /DNA_END=645 /DNA_ORIENTATION=-